MQKQDLPVVVSPGFDLEGTSIQDGIQAIRMGEFALFAHGEDSPRQRKLTDYYSVRNFVDNIAGQSS